MRDTNHKGRTPLIVAAMHGMEEMVKLLLGRGASVQCVQAKDKAGITALDWVRKKGHEGVARITVENTSEWKVSAPESEEIEIFN
jgi:ankyrin repeat protein